MRSTGRPTLAGNLKFDGQSPYADWAPGSVEVKIRMLSAAYDILKKEAAGLVWVETSYDLESARSRVKELAADSRDEYIIFDQRTRRIIANGAVQNART